MGENNNKRKSEFLGMPHGTANARLKKMILFQLVRETKKDTCFRCKSKIDSVDELSIEHKLPWEGRSVELFWDLNNIAFSHLKCNRPHVSGSLKLRKIRSTNESWCTPCQTFHSNSDFYKDSNRWNGLSRECKEASSVRTTKARSKNKNYGRL